MAGTKPWELEVARGFISTWSENKACLMQAHVASFQVSQAERLHWLQLYDESGSWAVSRRLTTPSELGITGTLVKSSQDFIKECYVSHQLCYT